MTLALSGFLTGLVHVLSGPDHLAAIAPYAVGGKTRAWRTGVRWGFGHATGALAVGLLVLVLREAFSVEAVSAWGERLVGLVLVVIGTWGLRAALLRRDRPGQPARNGHPHTHGTAAFAVGALHGLAGSSHWIGILPALGLPSDVDAAAYLLCLGSGSIVGMAGFAALIGWVASRLGASGAGVQRVLLGLCSATAVLVGGFWLFSSFPVGVLP